MKRLVYLAAAVAAIAIAVPAQAGNFFRVVDAGEKPATEQQAAPQPDVKQQGGDVYQVSHRNPSHHNLYRGPAFSNAYRGLQNNPSHHNAYRGAPFSNAYRSVRYNPSRHNLYRGAPFSNAYLGRQSWGNFGRYGGRGISFGGRGWRVNFGF